MPQAPTLDNFVALFETYNFGPFPIGEITIAWGPWLRRGSSVRCRSLCLRFSSSAPSCAG